MRKVILYSILLIIGLVGSQAVPGLAGDAYEAVAHLVKFVTMLGLAFIMIHVGYEFEIEKSNLRQYGWDYIVAATAAAFPWLFCAVYFVGFLCGPDAFASWESWKQSLLASRFAAPTSAGVLFSMLAAAGLGATWMFRKARILAIFDDLDTVLLMIPLKMLMVGARWQLGVVVIVMVGLIWLAWKYLHRWRIPLTWPWVVGYAAAISAVCEAIYFTSKIVDEVVPIHVEVLLPAFVLGCMAAKRGDHGDHGAQGANGEVDVLESPTEKRATAIVLACFMVLVGLSMPPLRGLAGPDEAVAAADTAAARAYVVEDDEADEALLVEPAPAEAWPGWSVIAAHVLVVTILSNLGKMFPVFCYRAEATWKQRLAIAVAMFPRGEVGAGVLVISLTYGIGGPMITVAMFSLALNLVCTGVFIVVVRKLLGPGA